MKDSTTARTRSDTCCPRQYGCTRHESRGRRSLDV